MVGSICPAKYTHLCLPTEHTCTAPNAVRCKYRDYVRQGRFAPSGSRPERGAGRATQPL